MRPFPAISVQPAGYARIRPTHPLCRGLVEYYLLGGYGVFDAVQGRLVDATYTGATRTVGGRGRQVEIASGSTNGLRLTGVAPRTVEFTALVLAAVDSSAWSSFGGLFSVADASGNGIVTLQNGGGNIFVYYDNAGAIDSTVAATTFFPANQWVLAGASNSANGLGFSIWRNGLMVRNALAITPNNVVAARLNVGNERTQGAARPGAYALFARWNRELSAAEHSQFAANPWQVLGLPRLLWVPAGPVALQFARPSSDASAGDWQPSTGTDLYATLDETPAADGDYVYTETDTGTARVKLATIGTPVAGTKTVRFRARAPWSNATVRITLDEGGVTVDQWTQSLTDTFATYSRTISGSITDWSNLYISFRALPN